MPPARNTEQTPEHDPAAADAAEEAAFVSGFDTDGSGEPHDDGGDAGGDEPAAKGKAATKAPKPAQGEEAATDPSGAASEDPFANLHPKVRERLDKLTDLETRDRARDEHQRRMDGRFAALQRELDAIKKAQPAPPPPAPPAKREAVRGELPEVAEMVDELEERVRQELDKRLGARSDGAEAPPAPPAAPGKDSDEQALEEVHPDWREKLRSDNFAAWLGQQPADYQEKVKKTRSAAVMSAALTKFDVAAASASPPSPPPPVDRTKAARQARVAASAARPKGAGGHPPDPSDEDEEEAAFRSGFEKAGSI